MNFSPPTGCIKKNVMRKPLQGKRIKIVKGNDYFGMTGVIEYCDRCCRAYRIQFDGIANSEKYKNYKDKLEFLAPHN